MSAMLKDHGAYAQLNDDLRAFVDDYVFNMRETADAIGVPLVNMLNAPIATAAIEASGGLLNNSTVKAAIVERVYSLANEVDLTVFAIVRELKLIAFNSIEGAFSLPVDHMTGEPIKGQGKVLNIDNLSADDWRVVQSYKRTQGMYGVNVEIKQYDKLKAIELLGKYMKIFDPDSDDFVQFQNKKPVEALSVDDTIEDAQELYSQAINS